MFNEIAVNLLITALFSGIFSLYNLLRPGKRTSEETYTQKLERLTKNLTRSSSEVDKVLMELTNVSQEREKTVNNLDTELRELEGREKQLKERIHDLENVPIAVAEHFSRLLADGERRSAARDYILFGAGVLVSTVIAIILKLVGF